MSLNMNQVECLSRDIFEVDSQDPFVVRKMINK